MTTLSDKAARRFYEALKPGAEWSYSNDAVIPLIKAAFALYADDWSPAKIGQWEWPFKMLVDGGSFDGDQPWTILLRRAVEMAKSPAPGLSVNKVLAVPQFLLDEATIGVLLASAKDCVATAAPGDAVLKPFITAAEAELVERGYPADYLANAASDTVDALVQAEEQLAAFAEFDKGNGGEDTDLADALASVRAAIVRERAGRDSDTIAAMQMGRGAITEAMEVHIYDADQGEKPEPDCGYVAAVKALDAAIANETHAKRMAANGPQWLADRIRIYAGEYRRKGSKPVNMRDTADLLESIARTVNNIEIARPDLLAALKAISNNPMPEAGKHTVRSMEAAEAGHRNAMVLVREAIAGTEGHATNPRAEFIGMIARMSASGDDMGEGEPAWEHDTGDGLDALDALIHKARKLAGMAHDADRAAMADPVSVRLVPEAEGDGNG